MQGYLEVANPIGFDCQIERSTKISFSTSLPPGGNLCYGGDISLVTEASELILANLLGFLGLEMFWGIYDTKNFWAVRLELFFWSNLREYPVTTQEGSNHKFNNLGAQCYPLKCLEVQCELRVETQSPQYGDSSILWSFSMRPSYDLDVPLHKIAICLTTQIYSNYVLSFVF